MALSARRRPVPFSVVLDSSEIQSLVAQEEARQAELFWPAASVVEWIEQQKGNPARKAFFEALALAPHITVQENTRCRVLQISKARCSDPEATVTFLKVVITDGPKKGEHAWICQIPYSTLFP
jgi:hypothetical protein